MWPCSSSQPYYCYYLSFFQQSLLVSLIINTIIKLVGSCFIGMFNTIQLWSTVTGSDYEVTVLTNPSSGPFLTNTVVGFFCFVDPQPPDPVTYNWEFQRNAEFSISDLFPGQNLSHIQLYLSFRFIWFFCKVYSNDTLVAVGSKLAEYHGKSLVHVVCVLLAS